MTPSLISVIVPVYKVEKYLDRCVQSIVDQTYTNLEIILVDDGSPDNCGTMCDAWAEKDSRIKVIHKENGGLSDARNAGMAIASGVYMGFIDSDDYIAPEMYQILLNRLHEDGSDIAACGVEMVFEDGSEPRRLTWNGCCTLNRDEAMEAIIQESWLKQPVWYKLYKTERIRTISFPVGKYHEDVFWSWQAVARADKVSVVDVPCYYYVQRSGSIMAERFSIRRLDAIEAKQERLNFIREEYPQLVALAGKNLIFSCMNQCQLAMRELQGKQKRQVAAELKKIVNHCDLSICSAPGTILHKCWLGLAKISLPLTCRIRNLLRVGL